MRPTPEEFADAWPRIVRALSTTTGSLDDAEEYAAESLARAAAHRGPIESLAAWCTTVGRRAWLDEQRRRTTLARLTPQLAEPDANETAMMSDPHDALGTATELDDRLALLYVTCDEELSQTSQLVLALRVVCGLTIPEIGAHLGIQDTAAAARLTRAKKTLREARGEFRIPSPAEREDRLPVVLACVAGLFTVAHRTALDPVDALADTARQALSIADALVATHPDDSEVRGLRAIIRLALARRPGRVDETGTALALDEVDRSRWDQELLRLGLADAAGAMDTKLLASRREVSTRREGGGTPGRFALEAGISGLHSIAPSLAETDWGTVVTLYEALEQVWPSPAVTVAHLAARMHRALTTQDLTELGHVEKDLLRLEAGSAAYARRDAGLALADLAWRTGQRERAVERYRALAEQLTAEPLRRFCLRRAADASGQGA
jgi:RNA polymerase sigma-70 factor (ECF subfamily)